MNEKTYEKITKPIRNYRHGVKMINIINNLFTTLVYLTYPIFLLKMGIDRDIRIWKVLLIPGISFILLSIFRKSINFSRPYEILNIDPIIYKDTRGKSFPSRHVFSVFIIAMNLYYISNFIGIILMFIGLIIAMIRVLGGVHFPRDVIAGAAIGILCGILGWNLFIW
ncbi:MAG: phosphatase PAP2 family protein [Tissierella sp.]|uniref:phosphatase PAP2 family protein n=1 Tax=Tissierella sp. TaxID=41274 RepID=UPI003F9D662D